MLMRRKRKLIILLVLVAAITVMGIGFAAFSTTLTISSQATIKPNPGDFELKIYGFIGSNEAEVYNENNYISETTATTISQIKNSIKFENKEVLIDNDSMSIDIGQVSITNPSDLSGVYVKVVNEGKYDAYFDTDQLKDFNIGTCTPEEGTSEKLVSDACPYIQLGIRVMQKPETLLAAGKYYNNQISYSEYLEQRKNDCFATANGICKLEQNKSVIMNIGTRYYDDNSPLADGPFLVTFPPLTVTFTSVSGVDNNE